MIELLFHHIGGRVLQKRQYTAAAALKSIPVRDRLGSGDLDEFVQALGKVRTVEMIEQIGWLDVMPSVMRGDLNTCQGMRERLFHLVETDLLKRKRITFFTFTLPLETCPRSDNSSLTFFNSSSRSPSE